MSELREKLGHPLKQALRDLGPQVFGEGWKYRLAAHAEVAVRTVHRWCDPGEKTRLPPPELIASLQEQALTLSTLRLRETLSTQLKHQIDVGQLHADVVAALLSDLADSFKTAKTPKDKIRSPKE